MCFDFPAGHIDRNLAIYFNKNTTLSINKSITILAL
ncbi:MAG: hypothetical protein ACOVLD_07415 [Bacteroidia bacterium]